AKLGRAYTEAFQTTQAIAALQRALALDQNCVEAHFYLGDLFRRLSRLEEAQQHLEHALALAPGDAHMHATLGEVFLQGQQGEADGARALAAYQEAVRLDPGLAEAHYGLGRAFARVGRWQDAAAELRLALRLEPGLGRAHYSLALV